MSRTPSQRDIARIAGVSQAAVSMVLNGKADTYQIAPATQLRIQEAIIELGYVPNINGRSLRGGRNGLIGVHTYESVFPVGPDDYYHEFLVGVEEAAVSMHQDLVLFASTQHADGTRRIYGEGGNRLRLADGAVFLGLEQNTDELERLAREEYPFVFIGRRELTGLPVPYVTGDYGAAVTAIVGQVADAGHRTVAYLGPTARFGPQEVRYAAFESETARRGILVAEVLFAEEDDITVDVLSRFLALGTTAVVVETPEVGEVLQQVAAALSIEIPQDLSIVLLDHPTRALASWSHLVIPRREMGARAVKLLLALLDGRIARDHREIIPCPPADVRTIAAPPTPASGTGSQVA